MNRVYSAFTMETILATVFGRAIDIQRNQSDQLAEAAAAMFEGIQEGANSSVYLAVVILSKHMNQTFTIYQPFLVTCN